MKVFLDHNSTTPLIPEAYEAMKPYYMNLFYNPGGIQDICQNINAEIEKSRLIISDLISHKKGRLIFTSSATEANNFVLSQNAVSNVITTKIEHPSVLEASLLYHKDNTAFVNLLYDGTVDIEDLEKKIKSAREKKGIILVSIQYANQVIHTIQPIDVISKICRKYEAFLHVDATQAFGKKSIFNLDVDFITVSAHKCYGPKGIAALWINDNLEEFHLNPLLAGGHQEWNLRAGTHNVSGIIGFKTAAEFMCSNYDEHESKVRILSERFYKSFINKIPDSTLNGNHTNRLPGGFHFSVPNVDMRAILISLPDIIVSTGMSCSSSESDPVLKALNKNDMIRNSFRMQIGFENTEEEIDIACESLTNAIIKSRSFWGML